MENGHTFSFHTPESSAVRLLLLEFFLNSLPYYEYVIRWFVPFGQPGDYTFIFFHSTCSFIVGQIM